MKEKRLDMSQLNKTVLIIDDEPDVRTYISTLLEDNGYATVTACDGEEALACVTKSRPDLITLDITMPVKSGVKFYREMKESDEWKTIPIIIVTGVSKDFKNFISTRRQVPPPEGFLHKPIEEAELLKLVEKLI
jgi:CheY-like chemotaxis protein